MGICQKKVIKYFFIVKNVLYLLLNMKSIIIFLFLFLFLSVSRESFAQKALPTASIDANWVVQIPNSSPVQKEYEASIALLNFSQEQAYRFFNWYSENLVVFQLDYASQKVKIILGVDYRATWTTTDWNTYLTQKANKAKSKNINF